MTYSQFAYVYDLLMTDVNYQEWVDFIDRNVTEKQRKKDCRILDLACGTGELSLKLADAGYLVTGIDLSEDMLAVASSKAVAANKAIQFYQQNMTELEGFDYFDIIVIFCDSLNYLQTEEEVKRTFRAVHQSLANDGRFMFDVHSIYKMTQIFMNQTFVSSDEEVSYIWNCYPAKFPNSVEHELTFFVKHDDSEDYVRFDETHKQRTFSIEQYKEWLADAGFEVLEITSDFGPSISGTSERIFFTCKKM